MDYLPGAIINSYRPRRFGVGFGQVHLKVLVDRLSLNESRIGEIQIELALHNLTEPPYGMDVSVLQFGSFSLGHFRVENAIQNITVPPYKIPSEAIQMAQVAYVSAFRFERSLINLFSSDYQQDDNGLELHAIWIAPLSIEFEGRDLTNPPFSLPIDAMASTNFDISAIVIEAI